MALGWGGAALSPSIYVAVPFVVAASIGNGAAIVSNALFMQRGAPDKYRGRAAATLMSLNYAVFGLAIAGAGVLTSAFGPREVWVGAALVYLLGAVAAFASTGWLARARDEHVLDQYGEAAAAALAKAEAVPREPIEQVRAPAREGTPAGLERIATLLEEIEARRDLEARRST